MRLRGWAQRLTIVFNELQELESLQDGRVEAFSTEMSSIWVAPYQYIRSASGVTPRLWTLQEIYLQSMDGSMHLRTRTLVAGRQAVVEAENGRV